MYMSDLLNRDIIYVKNTHCHLKTKTASSSYYASINLHPARLETVWLVVGGVPLCHFLIITHVYIDIWPFMADSLKHCAKRKKIFHTRDIGDI